MQTAILAPDTTAADSDFIVVTDTPKLVSVISGEIGARVGQAYMELWQRCLDGSSQRVQYQTPQGNVIVPRLSAQNRQLGLYLPGVYFLRRPVTDDAIGAELGDTEAADGLVFVALDSGSLTLEYDGEDDDLTGDIPTFAATGGTAPYTWTQSGLPAHLDIDGTTGVIEGDSTHAAPGTYNVTIIATDNVAQVGKLIVQVVVPDLIV